VPTVGSTTDQSAAYYNQTALGAVYGRHDRRVTVCPCSGWPGVWDPHWRCCLRSPDGQRVPDQVQYRILQYHAWLAESTNRSRSNHSGSTGSNRRNRVHNT
jgi:hypothetical protein